MYCGPGGDMMGTVLHIVHSILDESSSYPAAGDICCALPGGNRYSGSAYQARKWRCVDRRERTARR